MVITSQGFNRMIENTISRMDEISVRLVVEAVTKKGAILKTGKYYATGPVCVQALVNGKYEASCQYDHYMAMGSKFFPKVQDDNYVDWN